MLGPPFVKVVTAFCMTVLLSLPLPEEAMAQCTAEFRSFDARTGTYVNYGGKVRVCPYLE